VRRREFITLIGGAAAAWPLAARAQQPSPPVIGLLLAGTPEAFAPLVASFRKGLKETGYVDGDRIPLGEKHRRAPRARLHPAALLPLTAADLPCKGLLFIFIRQRMRLGLCG
jgi:hypothetical protein